MRTFILGGALALFAVALPTSASPEAAAPVHRTTLTLTDVTRRAAQLHPRARERAALLLAAEVARRRASWNRVAISAGLTGGYVVQGESLLATNRLSAGSLSGLNTTNPTRSTWDDGLVGYVFADLRVPLYAGGALDAAVGAAQARASAAREDAALTREDLKWIALRAYATVCAAERAMAVASAAKARADELVTLATVRAESGLGTAADVARSRLNRVRRDEELARRRGDVSAARALLRGALVLEPEDGESLELVDSLEAVADYRVDAKTTQFEVAAAQAKLRAAQYDVDGARAGYLPRVELFAAGTYGAGTMSSSPGDLGPMPILYGAPDRFSPLSGAVATGAVVTWRGFDGFLTRDRVAAARAEADAAECRKAEVARSVAERMAESRALEAAARERFDTLSGGLSVAREAVDLARSRYETGHAILTELLDAELDRIAVQSRSVEALRDLALAHIERLRAEGHTL